MDKNKTNELLPCPFCGGKAEIRPLELGTCLGNQGWWAFPTEKEVEEAWNKRARTATDGTETAVLREALRLACMEVDQLSSTYNCPHNPCPQKYRETGRANCLDCWQDYYMGRARKGMKVKV